MRTPSEIIVSVDDPELAQLLKDHNKKRESLFDMAAASKRFDAIYKRVQELKGIYLSWV